MTVLRPNAEAIRTLREEGEVGLLGAQYILTKDLMVDASRRAREDEGGADWRTRLILDILDTLIEKY